MLAGRWRSPGEGATYPSPTLMGPPPNPPLNQTQVIIFTQVLLAKQTRKQKQILWVNHCLFWQSTLQELLSNPIDRCCSKVVADSSFYSIGSSPLCRLLVCPGVGLLTSVCGFHALLSEATYATRISSVWKLVRIVLSNDGVKTSVKTCVNTV